MAQSLDKGIAQTHNLPTTRQGDSYNGTQFTVLLGPSGSQAPKDLTQTEIRVQFRQGSKTGPLQKQIGSGADGGITKTDALNGVFSIDAFIVDFPVVGKSTFYHYDVEFIDPNGTVKTYVEGTICVLPQTTDFSLTT